ncbi:MAG: protein lplB [Herbinix sp.]|jgi:putative aldouronate transport system permease protein|nr:protein lplB [Herbinix sp.]
MKQRSRKENFIRMLKRDAALHLMLLIPVTMLLIFHYIPLFGIIIAFQDYNPARGFSNSPFVGLNNFKELFMTPGFVQALKNTVIIALGKIVLGIIVPVTVALLLNEMRKARVKKTIQTMIYLPHFISWVLMAGIIIEILNPRNGMLNQFLGLFGIDPIFFLGSNKLFREIVWATDVWKEFGYATIIYMAALTSIDPSLYEAASLDGAGYFKKMLHITLPGISMTIVLLMTLKMGSILNAGFDQIFNLYSTITYESGDIIDTLVYRLGLGGGRFSLASAAGLFKSIISGTLLVVSYKVAHKTSGYRVF